MPKIWQRSITMDFALIDWNSIINSNPYYPIKFNKNGLKLGLKQKQMEQKNNIKCIWIQWGSSKGHSHHLLWVTPTNSSQSTQLLHLQLKRTKIYVLGFASVHFAAADGDLSIRYFRLISIFGQICYTIRKAAQTPIISRIHSFWKGRKLSTTKIKV